MRVALCIAAETARPMIYRPYAQEDFIALYAIEEACFQPPLRFGRGYMRRLVHAANAATWIADDNGRMAGFAIVDWRRDAGVVTAYIQTIEVAADQRRRGVGGELLRCVEQSARAAGAALLWLHVDEENSAAIHLYETHGFCREVREENYYARSRAALVLVKLLPPES